MSDKAELRQRLLEARLALSPEEVVHRSSIIVERLKELVPYTPRAVIHCYETMKSKHEVDVMPLIAFLQSQTPPPVVYTSRRLHDWWQVVSLDGEPLDRMPRFDCVIVPMLGFDQQTLHRLGNGGGYYDRMLSRQSAAFKVGVCFELGKLSDFPAKPHDIPLDVIVTEEQIYRHS